MKVQVFSWDRYDDVECVSVELPEGIKGRDLADLAEARVMDTWE
jgi:hypothetical protein